LIQSLTGITEIPHSMISTGQRLHIICQLIKTIPAFLRIKRIPIIMSTIPQNIFL
jgi:hypothetical protein